MSAARKIKAGSMDGEDQNAWDAQFRNFREVVPDQESRFCSRTEVIHLTPVVDGKICFFLSISLVKYETKNGGNYLPVFVVVEKERMVIQLLQKILIRNKEK